MFTAGRYLTHVSRWIFLVVLASIPFMYGGVTEFARTYLGTGLYLCVALWFLGQVFLARIPLSNGWSVLLGCALLTQGWWMTWNAHSILDPGFHQFLPIDGAWTFLPGAVAYYIAFDQMGLITAYMLTFWMVSDMAFGLAWRKRIWLTIAITGFIWSLLGISFKVGGAETAQLLWDETHARNTRLFSSFYNHSNAGAFLNLTWPICIAYTASAFRHQKQHLMRATWAVMVLVVAGAVLTNTSKVSLAVSLPMGLLMLVYLLRQRSEDERLSPLLAHLFVLTVLGCIMIYLVASTGWFTSWQNYIDSYESYGTFDSQRIIVYKVCLQMMSDAPVLGFGPGTFASKFPFYTHEYGDLVKGVWVYAHNDYLQTLVEWGFAGSILWAGFFLGGTLYTMHTLVAHKEWLGPTDEYAMLGSVVGVIAVLLQSLVDFPLQIPAIQLYAITLLAILWTPRKRE